MARRGQRGGGGGSGGGQRQYGSDAYWIDRHADPAADDDRTDEWLLSWPQLSPLLASDLLGATAAVDLGCGTSTLALDIVHDLHAVRILAVDIAPVLDIAVAITIVVDASGHASHPAAMLAQGPSRQPAVNSLGPSQG